MVDLERQQARQWLEELAQALEPWRLVLVSGNHLFAGAMVWSYPGVMHRASSLADLRGLLNGGKTSSAPESAAPTIAPTAGPCGAWRPIPQQILPIGSDPPGCLDPEVDPLLFLLCDDLPDGELEQALTLLQPIPPERRRVLADQGDRQRLQRLQEAGVDGLCRQGSIGQGRSYTGMDVIARGGTYLDPLFRQRLLELAGDGPMRCVHDLKALEGRLLRDACRSYNSLETAERQGLGSHRGLTPHRRMNRQQHPLPRAR
jgi:hypothetical protein